MTPLPGEMGSGQLACNLRQIAPGGEPEHFPMVMCHVIQAKKLPLGSLIQDVFDQSTEKRHRIFSVRIEIGRHELTGMKFEMVSRSKNRVSSFPRNDLVEREERD